jgi:hypothetical protein
MANENLAIDENMRNVLGAVTNDGNQQIRRIRGNPVTGALIVEANVTSSNTSIGSTIPGGTQGSILFLGLGGTLDQDNANLFYNNATNSVGIGTNTPSENLDVQGTANITGDTGTADELLGRDSGTGGISGVTVGVGLSLVAGVLTASIGGSGYTTIQNQGVSVTQRSTINLSNLLTATDTAGKTALTINVANLASDATFLSNLDLSTISGLLDLSTQVTGILNVSHLDQTTFNIGTMGGLINLATQVTGVLPIAHGGTNSSTALSGSSIMISNGTAIVQGAAGTTTTVLHGNAAGAPTYSAVTLTADVTGVLPLANGGTASALSDPGANKILAWDDTDNTIGFWTLGSGLSYSHSTHTLSASGGVDITNVNVFDDFLGLVDQATLVGDPVILGQETWTQYTAGGATMLAAEFASVSNHPGIIQLQESNSTSNGIALSGQNGRTTFDLTKPFTFEMLVYFPSTASTQAGYFFGLVPTGQDPVNTLNTTRIGINADAKSGNVFTGYTGNGAANTASGSTAALAKDTWYKIKTTFDGTTVEWFVDGVSLGTTTSTLPTGQAVLAQVGCRLTVANHAEWLIDYMTLNYQITR